jgi:hypothetical protein
VIIHEGNMWTAWDNVDLFLFTSNGTITQSGRLVMGRGMARQVLDRFPNVDVALGQSIGQSAIEKTYGLLVSPRWPAAKLGAFQVKYRWQDCALPEMIRHSARMLRDWCAEHPQAKVALNFPGIGNGGLQWKDVYPIIAPLLTDQVQVWIATMPRVLISGSREASAKLCANAVLHARHAFSEGKRVIVGDNPQGVDAAVVRACEENGYIYSCYGKDPQARNGAKHYVQLKVSTYKERDLKMVRLANQVCCFWDGKSPGTREVYTLAFRQDKPRVLISDQSGHVETITSSLDGRVEEVGQ